MKFGKKELLGVDIGSRSVKLVKLIHPNGGKPRLDACALLEIQKSSPNFVPAFHDALEQHNLLGLSAAACIDDPGLRTAKLELPAMPEGDLRDAVRWKMRDAVEGSVDEYSVAHSIIDETVAAGTRRLVVAAFALKRQEVAERISLLSRVGLKPVVVEPSIVSLAACLDCVYPSADHFVGGVDIGGDAAQMVIIGKGKFYFSRNLPGVALNTAETDVTPFIKKLAVEVQTTLDTFSVSFNVEKVHRLYLSGGGAGVPGLTDYLTTNLAVPTEILNPFVGIEVPPGMEKIVKAIPFVYGQAVALALMNG